LTAKTYEMHMFHSASLKLGLERAVLSQNRDQGEETDDGAKSTRKRDNEVRAKEIDQLLKKGAYDVFREDVDGESEKFMEADIDQLLESKSKTVTYGAAATSSLGSGLGSFSKASFVADTGGGEKDIDLDDPDFWSKAVGLDAPPEDTPEEIAAMLDDGVKRSRKQVEQYDPYAETAMAEQLKKERIAVEKMLEQEEKERLQEEKRLKQRKAKQEKRKKQREENNKLKEQEKSEMQTEKEKKESKHSKDLKERNAVVLQPKKVDTTAPVIAAVKVPKLSKGLMPKSRSRKGDRVRALQRAENEDPPIEKFKQAWDVPQRNRATAAAIRFGFERFCKLRSEANLSSLPLQDLEVFTRCYIYQLSLQVVVTLMSRVRRNLNPDDVRALLHQWIGFRCVREVNWISDSFISALELQAEVESGRRLLRMPVTLNEPVYVSDLRHGAGLRALRRICTLARLNSLIGQCLDATLYSLGSEELGRRGCGGQDPATLDLDLKARFLSREEFSLAVGSTFRKLLLKEPSCWWDRDCDVALVVGTFVHGMGNYDAMRRDHSLPFADKIKYFARRDTASKTATQRFNVAATATRKVFDDALEAARIKAELEVQAAVAAAAKAASKREQQAALVRQGGIVAEIAAQHLPDTQVEDAFVYDGTDTHYVTLRRLHENLRKAARQDLSTRPVQGVPDEIKSDAETECKQEGATYNTKWRSKERSLLPMPDARVLDYRLVRILDEMEKSCFGVEADDDDQNTNFWRQSAVVSTIIQLRSEVLPVFHSDASYLIGEHAGIGLGGNQCGTSHRSLNDGSDYAFGSASHQISLLAYGTDAPRYLRAVGIPMNVSCFAINGLVYADTACVNELLGSERLRFYGLENGIEKDSEAKIQSTQNPTENMNISDEVLKEGSSISVQLPLGKQRTGQPVDPVDRIAEPFRTDAKLRAGLCLAVLFYGFPSRARCNLNINYEVWTNLRDECFTQLNQPDKMFDVEMFRQVVADMVPDVLVPDAEAIEKYVETVLLPHCLRLCVGGNGPSTKNARGSHGDYETAFGVSIHPEPSQPHPSPIPDPCLTLQEHSLEALGCANAILRRVQLLRSCVYLCSEGSAVSANFLVSVAKSSEMGFLDGFPVWWCPWVHDLGLLCHAATHGLFSIMKNRENETIFSQYSLDIFMKSKFSAFEQSTSDEVVDWIEEHIKEFPTLFQIERRLGMLCSQATESADAEFRFDLIPMFDHGGWPRN
jgi:hypothetical protein